MAFVGPKDERAGVMGCGEVGNEAGREQPVRSGRRPNRWCMEWCPVVLAGVLAMSGTVLAAPKTGCPVGQSGPSQPWKWQQRRSRTGLAIGRGGLDVNPVAIVF